MAKTPLIVEPNLLRPISLTSVVCKVLAHLCVVSVLTAREHSFLPRRSTLTNLLVAEELIRKWLDEGSAVDLIYLDFSKAFESCHSYFFAKISMVNIW